MLVGQAVDFSALPALRIIYKRKNILIIFLDRHSGPIKELRVWMRRKAHGRMLDKPVCMDLE